MRSLFFIFSILILSSCSEERNFTPIDMYMMAFDYDNTIEEVRINDPTLSIKCTSYPEGCMKGSPKRFKVRLVEMIVAQYFRESQACLAALKLDQYYSRNWLFDDVKGEPVLESFVKEVWDAKNPQEPSECER